MNSFIDTNVSIAYTFLLDPLNSKSISVFNKYDSIYWSNRVEQEFNKVFIKKIRILNKFYRELLKILKEDFPVNFSFKYLDNYVTTMNYSKYEITQIKSSLSNFWNTYVNDRRPSLKVVTSSIEDCLNDLNILIRNRRENLENKVKITDKREKSYDNLVYKLSSFNIHFEDMEIVLDAHDFNLRKYFDLDFITFDKICYEGVSKIKEFSFHSIKGKNDFL